MDLTPEQEQIVAAPPEAHVLVTAGPGTGKTHTLVARLERLTADLKDAMRAGETVRRDEIRGVIAMLKAEQQAKLTRALGKQGLILHGDNDKL